MLEIESRALCMLSFFFSTFLFFQSYYVSRLALGSSVSPASASPVAEVWVCTTVSYFPQIGKLHFLLLFTSKCLLTSLRLHPWPMHGTLRSCWISRHLETDDYRTCSVWLVLTQLRFAVGLRVWSTLMNVWHDFENHMLCYPDLSSL